MEKNDLKFLILFFYYNRPEMVLNAIKSLNKNTKLKKTLKQHLLMMEVTNQEKKLLEMN